MNYQQTLHYLFNHLPMFQRIGPAAYKKDLTNTLAICERLGNPHHRFPTLHVAGTNGKGSVAHMLSAILQSAGFKTGLYVSPHYKDFRERIKVNGQYISRPFVSRFVSKHQAFFEELQPSFFEMSVGMAFDYFAAQQVDIAVVEVGLGGRLDSTNVITPLVSVVTNISFDHVSMLGNTLPLIAAEKAGIIKPGVPVVIGEEQTETSPVFLQKAKECQSPIYFASREIECKSLEDNYFQSRFAVAIQGKLKYPDLLLDAGGAYQSKNLATVLQTIEVLRQNRPFQIPDEAVEHGLAHLKELTRFIGRWQIIGRDPLVLLDSAHNEGGLRLAMEQIARIPHRKLHFVFGMVNDKEPSLVLNLLPKAARYYFAKANIPRGLDADALRITAAEHGLHGKAYASVRNALHAARRAAEKDDLIYVGGSIFIVAEVM